MMEQERRGGGRPPTAGEEGAREWVIRGVRVPQALLTPCPPPCAGAEEVDEDGLLLVDLCVADGKIARISRSCSSSSTTQGGAEDAQNGNSLVVDGRGRMCLPAFVDMHTHIDKSHTCERSRNENGSLSGADRSTCDDARFWTLEDAMRRMRFCLECAYHHGTMAVRTHLISVQLAQRQIAWAAFTALRDEWKGRLELQGVALTLLTDWKDQTYGDDIADLVHTCGGVLGCAVSCGEHGGKDVDEVTTCGKELPRLLDRIFRAASARNLDLDFHVDENGNAEATGLRSIAQAVLRNEFTGRVVCGHCCSLASQTDDALRETLALCKTAGVYLVTLPVVNMWLQDRDHDGKRTPRWRGTTLVKEVAAAGVPVAISSDNVRDQFYAYGDMDLLDIFRQSTLICHLDRPNMGSWPCSVTSVPAQAMRLPAHTGHIAVGGGADFIVFSARCYSELFSRPQTDRIVVRNGVTAVTRLPSFTELDCDTNCGSVVSIDNDDEHGENGKSLSSSEKDATKNHHSTRRDPHLSCPASETDL